MIVQSLGRIPTFESLGESPRQLVGGIRLWALATRLRWCPVRTVAQRLGSLRAAAHLRLIIDEVGAAWPDPFCIAPPCSPRLSHDEATAAQMLGLAESDDRPGFDRLLCDLLPGDERERLFLSFSVLSSVLDGRSRSPGSL